MLSGWELRIFSAPRQAKYYRRNISNDSSKPKLFSREDINFQRVFFCRRNEMFPRREQKQTTNIRRQHLIYFMFHRNKDETYARLSHVKAFYVCGKSISKWDKCARQLQRDARHVKFLYRSWNFPRIETALTNYVATQPHHKRFKNSEWKVFFVMKISAAQHQRSENGKIMSWWNAQRAWRRHACDRRLPIVSEFSDGKRETLLARTQQENLFKHLLRRVINFYFSFLFLIWRKSWKLGGNFSHFQFFSFDCGIN